MIIVTVNEQGRQSLDTHVVPLKLAREHESYTLHVHVGVQLLHAE